MRAVLLSVLIVVFTASAKSQQGGTQPAAAIRLGSTAVSGFSGAKLSVEGLPPGVDPAEKTVIDTDGVALRIFDLSNVGADLAGQAVNPPANVQIKASEIGQVFGLVFDNGSADGPTPPNLYAGASSAFGLHIVVPDGSGQTKTVRTGAASAKFMDGQFGTGGGPGSIWKIDGTTGQVSLFGKVASGGADNSGPGIGDLAFDAKSGTLYASDLDTGLIHRLDPAGTDAGQFDHGVTGRPAASLPAVEADTVRAGIASPDFKVDDPGTWGFAPKERRVDGLAVHNGRLYYAVAAGPEIWSVGLEDDGKFKQDARREVEVKAANPSPVTGIVFDGSGRMILAQRGPVKNPADFARFVDAENAQLLRYRPKEPADAAAPWVADPDEFAVGFAANNRNVTGGVALQYAYGPGGVLDLQTCRTTLIATGDVLAPQGQSRVEGVQINGADLVKPDNQPPNRSAFVDYDALSDDLETLGHVGGVAVAQACDPGAGFPPVAGGGAPPVDGGGGTPPVVDGGGAVFPPVEGGGGGAAVPPDEAGQGGGGLATEALKVVKTGVATCSPKGGCAFTITVSNPNAAQVDGPIVIDEQIDAPQATLTGEPNAPWACTKAAPFTCEHPGPIPANGSLDMRLVFAPNTPPETKAVKNCALLRDTAATAPEQCATVALDPNAPAQTGPIVVAKKGASACTAKGPCAFTITVTNTTAADVPGPFVVDEQIDAPQAALAGEPNAPWTCSKAAPFSCTHPGPLPANTTTELNLSFTPNTPPEKTELKNCAIPVTGVGGKAVPGEPAPANPLVPEKKTEVPPFGKSVLFKPASFRPQSLRPRSGLFTLTGGAGGNIGGVQQNRCLSSRAPPAFSVQQADGTAITFENVIVDAAGNITGSARIFTSRRGTFSGRFDGGLLSFLLVWSDGTRGDYTGRMDAEGNLNGLTRDIAGGPSVKFTGLQAWPCGRDQFCSDYATKATNLAKEFADLRCGPSVERWSTDSNHHLNWCMGQDKKSPFLSSEPEARANELTACRDGLNARMKACIALVPPQVSKSLQEAEKLGCIAAASGAVANKQMGLCALGKDHDLAGAMQTLDNESKACVAEKLAAAGGGAGQGPAPIPAAEPAPEQCAVVPINPETPGGEGEPAPAPQASVAGTVSLTKTAGACRADRSCDFMITVANTADAPFNGPVEFADEVTGDGALFGNAALTAQQPWTCPKTGQIFACTATLTLAANEKKDFPFTADLGAGAVKEMKNCATLQGAPASSCATAPLVQVQPPPAPPPAAANNLVITKNPEVEQCSDAGGGCVFTVSITNPGPNAFTGPITVSDNLTDINGKTFPNVDFGNIVPSSPSGSNVPFICTKGGGGFVCTTADRPVNLPANGTIKITTDIKPGAGTGATSIRNCAQLIGQGVNTEQVCRTMPLINGPLLRATKLTAATSCNPECFFSVSVRNVGNADALAPFTFTDRFTPATKIIPIFTEGGDFTCRLATEQGNGVAVCNGNKNVLKPGEQMLGKIAIKGVPLAPEYTNCIEISPAGGPVDTTFLGRCVTIKEPRPQRPELAVIKLVQDPLIGGSKVGECKIEGPCNYKVLVMNRGNATYEGPITFTDEVPEEPRAGVKQSVPGAINVKADPAWTCTNPNPRTISCTHSRTTLPPSDGVSIDLVVTPGANWKKNDVITNCARIATPVGNDAGDNKVNDAECASSQLDPFAVKVEKTGDQACAPGGDCKFQLTLFNPGPIDHNAPVTISDKLTGLSSAQIVSIDPPFPPELCATPPTQIPFSCTSPGAFPLPLDSPPMIFNMVVRLPNDATAESFSNCASVAGDTAEAPAAQSCVTVKKAPPVVTAPSGVMSITKTALSPTCDESAPCNFKITIANATGQAIAGPIVVDDLLTIGAEPSTQVKLASGPSAPWTCVASAAPGMQCSHPGPLANNASLDLTMGLQPLPGSIGTATEVKNCATLAGVRPGRGTACASIPVKAAVAAKPPSTATCSGGMILTGAGLCSCPPAMQWNGRACMGTGGINPANQPGPGPTVPPKLPSPATCSGGMILTGAGLCACPPAMQWTGRVCVGTGGPSPSKSQPVKDDPAPPPKQPPPECPSNRPVGTFPDCCPRDTEFKNGACRPFTGGSNKANPSEDKPAPKPRPPKKEQPPKKAEPPECPRNRPVGRFPNCCPRDTEFKNGSCRAINCPTGTTGVPPVCCPRSQRFVNGQCVPRERPTPVVCPTGTTGVPPVCCPRSQRFVNGQCVPRERPTPVVCPPGTIFVNGQCRRLAVPTPTTPPKRDCGPGYRVLDRPNKYGSYCEQIPSAGPCPPGWSGTQPNCKAPVKPQQPPPPPKVCPPNATGTPPRCNCRGNSDYDAGANVCIRGPA